MTLNGAYFSDTLFLIPLFICVAAFINKPLFYLFGIWLTKIAILILGCTSLFLAVNEWLWAVSSNAASTRFFTAHIFHFKGAFFIDSFNGLLIISLIAGLFTSVLLLPTSIFRKEAMGIFFVLALLIVSLCAERIFDSITLFAISGTFLILTIRSHLAEASQIALTRLFIIELVADFLLLLGCIIAKPTLAAPTIFAGLTLRIFPFCSKYMIDIFVKQSAAWQTAFACVFLQGSLIIYSYFRVLLADTIFHYTFFGFTLVVLAIMLFRLKQSQHRLVVFSIWILTALLITTCIFLPTLSHFVIAASFIVAPLVLQFEFVVDFSPSPSYLEVLLERILNHVSNVTIYFTKAIWRVFVLSVWVYLPNLILSFIGFLLRILHNGHPQRTPAVIIAGIVLFLVYYVGVMG